MIPFDENTALRILIKRYIVIKVTHHFYYCATIGSGGMDIRMKRIKLIEAVIGGICLLFGLVGFCLSFVESISNKGVFYTAKAINHINGVAVDVDKNIYIGDEEGGYIQVFNNDGTFQYGFSFTTGRGRFAFGVDDQNIVHIVTARTKDYLEYYNGEPLCVQGIDGDLAQGIENSYHMSSGTTFVNDNLQYKTTLFHKVRIYDPSGNLIKTISLKVPIFPLSMSCYSLIGTFGMGLLLLVRIIPNRRK